MSFLPCKMVNEENLQHIFKIEINTNEKNEIKC